MTSRFTWNPRTYADQIRAQVPGYDALQAAAIEAIPFTPKRILELGVGTAETTERIWERYPDAQITGLDSSGEMVFHARGLGWEQIRLARIEDPLPDGPWDLVISVLTVHHLDDDGKRDLFRRVGQHSRALVIGDVVAVDPADRVTTLDEQRDHPTAADEQAAWCGGEVVWQQRDLAVIRATYGEPVEQSSAVGEG